MEKEKETPEVKDPIVPAVPDDKGVAPSTPPENVPSAPEVKKEDPIVGSENASKLEEQIKNLNIALKQERESNKTSESKVQKLTDDLSDYQTRLKKAFGVEQEPEVDENQEALSEEKIQELVDQKWQEKEKQVTEDTQKEMLKKEISEMETKWDGSEGKPKYDDEEVMSWQDKTKKLHLSPQEAFEVMKKNEILDWEIKQRLSNKKPSSDVEQPSSQRGGEIKKEDGPKSDSDVLKMVQEAIEKAEAEM